ncbi:MAG: SgcJ/EcaC family oxidoreductase [Deltaproteobacteria bacterium]|nr:SgcJ/EcaC family oxidoreductase [Deltaproteobacteria bacterium]
MLKSLRLVLCSFLLVAAGVQAAGAFGSGMPASDVANEKLVRKLYETFVNEWNAHRVNDMADLWAIDGDHVDPDGRMVKGRDEVRALFTKQHEVVFAKTKLTLTVASVWFVSEDIALVDGTYAITGIVDPKGNEIAERKGLLTSILLKEKGNWLIEASRLMIPAPLPWRRD